MGTPKARDDHEPMTVRFPAGLLDALRALARADERSLNGEIVYALRAFAERRTIEAREREEGQARDGDE